MNKADPKYLFESDQRNNFSFDKEKRKAAGTAQDTVGQPGSKIPISAKTTNKEPKAT